ncbi:hypothetical protein GCM10009841_10580 [Microlunatus panaciterrae]
MAATSLLSALMIIAGQACSRSEPGPGPVPAPHWSRVALPDGLDPTVLALLPGSGGAAAETLVGAQLTTNPPAPRLLRVTAGETVSPIPLEPVSPYARVAQFRALDSDGSRVVALGGRSGGAHGNVRWTVWTGTRAAVREHPQTFETFGGQQAGALVDIVLTDRGPVVVGSWTGTAGGLDAAVWLPRGDTWLRRDSTGTPLASSKTRLVLARAAVADGAAVVIAGSTIRLADGVRQGAAVWRADSPDGDWRRTDLPDPGGRSEAQSVACSGDACWVAGQVDGRLALWSLMASSAARTTLPDTAVDPSGPAARVVSGPARTVVAYSQDGHSRVLLGPSGGAGGWSRRTGPDGDLVDAVLQQSRLYLLTRRGTGPAELWLAELG